MNIENSLKRAEVLFVKGDYQQSLSLCKSLLVKKPKLFNALHQSALNYQAMNNIEEAIVFFERAIKINDKNSVVLNNFGNIYIGEKNYQKAISYYIKALKIDPSHANAHGNFALCQFKLGNMDLAENHYKKSILYGNKNVEFYNSLGDFYASKGLFEKALEMLLKSLELKVEAQTYWDAFEIQLYTHRYQDALDVADMGLVSKPLEHELYQWLVGKAIVYWLFNKLEDAKNAIDLSERIYEFASMSEHMSNMVTFHRYIKKLLVFRLAHADLYSEGQHDELPEMYFISESHGLSPNDTLIEYNKKKYKVRSLFIMGAKVFHLTSVKDNKYQVSLSRLLADIPPSSKVILGFGEIDCRIDEGVYVYCQQSGKNYKEVIDSMLNEYVATLKEIATAYELEIILYGVPSPHHSCIEQLEEEDREEFKKLIEYFNMSLADECKSHAMKLLDVYSITNEKGQSNLEYHIDDHHLSPNILKELF